MNIIEGQAFFPEAKNVKSWNGKIGYSQDLKWDEKPHADDGTEEGSESSEDVVLSGQAIGASKLASVREHSYSMKLVFSFRLDNKLFFKMS